MADPMKTVRHALTKAGLEIEARCGACDLSEEIDAALAAIEQLEAKAIRIEVENADDLPGFGAYCAGSASDGKGIIILNVKMCAAAAGEGMDARAVIANTLAHEILHACEEVIGVAFDDAAIEKALANAAGFEVETESFDVQLAQAEARGIERAAEVARRNGWDVTADQIMALLPAPAAGNERTT